jgi:hypothetical protein
MARSQAQLCTVQQEGQKEDERKQDMPRPVHRFGRLPLNLGINNREAVPIAVNQGTGERRRFTKADLAEKPIREDAP